MQTAFLIKSGWNGADSHMVAGDASNRKYHRLTMNGQTAILMDAPPEKGEDTRPFVRIARHLKKLGLSAPEIFYEDKDTGFLLLEDLGDDLYARVVKADPAAEDTLYRAATEVLVTLHRAALPDVPPYDVALMTEMAALAYDWYAAFALDRDVAQQCEAFKTAFSQILDQHTAGSKVLIQRDYHAENLLWLPDRDGVARVGLLDFQDAMVGHAAYDLVSVLQDARRDVPEHVEEDMIAHYVSKSGADDGLFRMAYAVLGVQRNLRIIGVFTRLFVRDGKAHYVDLIPRVWGLLQRNLATPALGPIEEIIMRDLPQPTHPVLERIKAKCPAPRKP